MKLAFAIIVTLPYIATAQSAYNTDALWNEATVYRDEWGVPHVYANSTRAMAFAFGYAQAEDHLEHILLAYRVANGRASEVYGDRFVASDTYAQLMRHSELATTAYATLDATTQDLCDGFALGINSWIVEHPAQVPKWAEGVRPEDVLAFFHHYLMTMAPFDYKGMYHPARGTPQANAWALAPSRTKEGQSILVMNPHTDYDSIFQWYEAHLSTRDLNVYGATLYGLPVLLMGHNETLGWALAPNEPDIGDVFAVLNAPEPEVNPSVVRQAVKRYTPNRFTNESDTKPYFVWTNKGLAERFTQRYMTRLGPVVAFEQGIPYAYQVGGFRDFGGLRQLYDMGRAQDLERFQAVWNRQQLPLFHAVYTDRIGNLFYSYNAKVGDKSFLPEHRESQSRLARTAWEEPLSNRTPGAMWGSLLTPAQLPWLINPDSGYIQASGTPPWLVTEGTGWSRDSFADWLVRDPDTYRAKRLRQLFQNGTFSFEDNQSILYDTVVPLAVEVVPYLYRAAQANESYVYNSHPDLLVALKMLGEWDYLAHPDSSAMTFFHVWWTLFSREYEHRATASEALHAMLLQETEEMQRYLLDTAANAARMMRDYYQTVQIPWGEAHVIRRGDKEVSIGGASTGEPIFGIDDTYFENGKWVAKQGPAFTMAIQFDDVPKAVSWVPFGASENPESRHYDDQLPLMRERRFKHARFTRADVEAHSMNAYGKVIAFRPEESGAAVVVRALQPVHVRLGLSTTLSASLPADAAAYSPYLEPVATPASTPIESTLQFHVPESLCSEETLRQLAVYTYSPRDGWSAVQEQELDLNTRTFYARGYGREVYAVLGPDTGLSGTLEREQYASYIPDLAFLASASPATTQSTSGSESITQPLSAVEQERIARSYPPIPTESTTDNNFEPPRVIVHRPFANFNGVPIPAIPPGWEEYILQAPIPVATSAPPALLPPMPRKQTTLKKDDAESKAEIIPDLKRDSGSPGTLASPKGLTMLNSAENKIAKADSSSSKSSAPLPQDVIVEDLSPQPIARTEKSETPQDIIKRHQEARAPAQPENPFRKNQGVVWRDGLPDELNSKTANREPEKLELAYNADLATTLEFGKSISFALPNFNASFDLNMQRTVRAQIELLPTPPESFPSGKVPFSAVFSVLYKDLGIPGTLAGSIRINQQVCAPDSFDQLSLYAYDPENGWVELLGITKSKPDMSFIFLDRFVRTYAVLGPASAQIATPKMQP